MNAWLTTKKAAAALGISDARVRQMIRDGVIQESQKLGRDHLIPAGEIDRLKRSDRRPGRPPKTRD